MALKIRSFLIQFAIVCFIFGTSAAVIAYGRGYRINTGKNTLSPTGLVSATSDPIGAQVFVDGKLKTATNNSFNLTPGHYQVTIAKEGFASWQKRLRIQGEIVSRADAFLFPSNPSLSPLTTLGVTNPVLSNDGTKIAYVIPVKGLDNGLGKKAGLWIYEVSEGPLGRNRDPLQIASVMIGFDIEGSVLRWSPDSTHILAVAGSKARLYQLGRLDTFKDVSGQTASLLKEWDSELSAKALQQLEVFKQPIVDMATSSARIISMSPDETKILYEATAAATIPKIIDPPLIGANPTEEHRSLTRGNIYVYDSKEDKNYLVLEQSELPKPTPSPILSKNKSITPSPLLASDFSLLTSFIHWFPTSRHLIVVLPGKIDVMEFDRTNWVTVYAGPFEERFVAPWANGNRIVILTNLNPGTSSLPNLYTVNLR